MKASRVSHVRRPPSGPPPDAPEPGAREPGADSTGEILLNRPIPGAEKILSAAPPAPAARPLTASGLPVPLPAGLAEPQPKAGAAPADQPDGGAAALAALVAGADAPAGVAGVVSEAADPAAATIPPEVVPLVLGAQAASPAAPASRRLGRRTEPGAVPAGPPGGMLWALQEQFGSAPWWAVSAVVHVLLVLMTMLITIAVRTPTPTEQILFTQMTKPPKPPLPIHRPAINPRQVDIELPEFVEHPVFSHEQVEIKDFVEVVAENESETPNVQGDEAAISDVPTGGEGVTGTLGIGQSPPSGVFGNREPSSGRSKAVTRNGGTVASESAVAMGLAWLARHQEADGHWSGKTYEGGDHAALTGLALLAFLGAGHTENVGQYQENVRRAVNYLISLQFENGLITDHDGRGTSPRPSQGKDRGYNHSICGLALAEAYGMSRKSRTGEAAQKAVDYSVNVHQGKYGDGRPGGWRYQAGNHGDTSHSGWFTMQLKSAKIAGLKVPDQGFVGSKNFLDEVTILPTDRDRKGGGPPPTGKANADDEYGGDYEVQGNVGCAGYTDKSAQRVCCTAIGMACRVFMGEPPASPQVLGAVKQISENPPVWPGSRGDSDDESFYYWYYATLGTFQVGGSWWQEWNSKCRDMLVNHQRLDGQPSNAVTDVHGSWDPVGRHLRSGGRIMSTSMGVLILEVYYRYLPVYR